MARFAPILAMLAAYGAWATDPPQTTDRGVHNGVTMGPAPAPVARGGIIAVIGTGLAPDLLQAESTPLPLSLGDPAIEVLVNGIPAPLFFVSPEQIKAQMPWEVEAGWADVIVRHGDVDSLPMPVQVFDADPDLFLHEGTSSVIAQSVSDVDDPAATPASGSAPLSLGAPGSPSATGEVLDAGAVVAPGQVVAVYAAGLGQTEPPLVTGAPAPPAGGLVPVEPQRAYLGGLPAAISSVGPSEELVGVFEMHVEMPELAGPAEVLRWYAGDRSAAAVLGASSPPAARYMAVEPRGEDPAVRLQRSDLNPLFVAVNGVPDEIDFCYRNVQLLDFRRDASTVLSTCVFPSNPNAVIEGAYRPFELSWGTSFLAALAEPSADVTDGITDRVLLLDTAEGSETLLELSPAADRLQSGFGGTRPLRLQRPQAGTFTLVEPESSEQQELVGFQPLPDPLEVDGRTRMVAQQMNFAGGYRLRFLGRPEEAESVDAIAVLYNGEASIVANVPFPEGWLPVAPPRSLNNQGLPIGTSLAPTTGGFRGDQIAYLAVRSAAGTGDAVLVLRPALPEDPEAPLPEAIDVSMSVVPFPAGSYATSCGPLVRWQRIVLTRTLAILGSGEAMDEFANPRDGQLCTGDRLVLFNTATDTIQSVDSPNLLELGAKGVVRDFLYFADGSREVPLEAPRAVHVFDGVNETFHEITLPEDLGITINPLLDQRMWGTARIVAPATTGPPRTNPRTGALMPPLPGNSGLLVVQLVDGTVTHLALPEGYQRIHPGNPRFINRGHGRPYGVIPLIGRAFARGVRRGSGPGNPGGTAMLTWDVATGEATEIALPEDGFAVIQAAGGRNANQRPILWSYSPRSVSFAFGVYNRDRDLIAVGVVGP